MGLYDPQQTILTFAAAWVIYALYRRYNRPSFKDIPGPPNPSWVHGKLGDPLVVWFGLLILIQRSSVVLAEPRCQRR